MPDLKINFHVNDLLDGFQIRAIAKLADLKMIAIQMEHLKTGARLLHLYNDDAENLFSISFPTPPPDDTGVPHIMEHCVLAGSKKFPVREPFFEMVKMSMATFINAMTGWESTYYPVASNVKQDLFNLAEVYFDAVFHPLLTEQSFKREAHHLAPADRDDPTGDLTINGIVYNEMLGNFSDPESRLYREMSRALFPDSIYGRESGGDPESIPDLTYDDFKKFFQTYYHPSNSYFLFYGNIPTSEYLAFLKDKLNAFEQQSGAPEIDYQPRWNHPRSITESYPIGKDESLDEKTYVVVSWLIGKGTDPLDIASFHILSNILLGNEAAPLKKAIIDSKLGQDLIYSGFSPVGLETVFRVGLKGAEPNRADAFVDLVLKTLTDMAQNEIDRELVDAAFQQAAYHYREILPSYPLHLMDRVLEAWIFGADPLTFVRMNEHLATCRHQYEGDARFFHKLIEERILKNDHRLTFVLKPDREWQSRYDAAFAERMNQTRARFSEDQLLAIASEAERLEALSGTPNSPEALATLPQLQVSDLPSMPQHIPTTVTKLGDRVDFLNNEVFANGVNYLYLNFDLNGLPADLWQFLPRYSDAIQKLGAAGMNYEQIARRIAASTGGINCWESFSTHVLNPKRPVWGLKFSMKALDEQVEPALDILRDLIFAVDPRDQERLRDVIIQANANYRTDLVHDGSNTASRYAARGFTPEGHLEEIVNGLPQLELTEKFNKQFDRLHAELMEKIEQIRDFILAPERLTISFTGSDRAQKIIADALASWIHRMPGSPTAGQSFRFVPFAAPPREGLAGPMQVAFCSQIIPAPHFSHPDAAYLKLGTRMISMEYMLNEVRFKGNAYGAWCRYNSLQREVELGSYRDPHIVRTLDVFHGILDYVRKADWSQIDVDRAIIGTAKNFEEPIRPKDAAKRALHRHLTGQTNEVREANYQRICSATLNHVRRATLELLDANLEQSSICVVSSREKLEEANRHLQGKQMKIKDIL